MRVSYCREYYATIPEEHIFPMKKFQGLYTYLTENGILKNEHIIPPPMVEFSHLIAAHTKRYSFAVWDGTLNKKEARRIGLPWQ